MGKLGDPKLGGGRNWVKSDMNYDVLVPLLKLKISHRGIRIAQMCIKIFPRQIESTIKTLFRLCHNIIRDLDAFYQN